MMRTSSLAHSAHVLGFFYFWACEDAAVFEVCTRFSRFTLSSIPSSASLRSDDSFHEDRVEGGAKVSLAGSATQIGMVSKFYNVPQLLLSIARGATQYIFIPIYCNINFNNLQYCFKYWKLFVNLYVLSQKMQTLCYHPQRIIRERQIISRLQVCVANLTIAVNEEKTGRHGRLYGSKLGTKYIAANSSIVEYTVFENAIVKWQERNEFRLVLNEKKELRSFFKVNSDVADNRKKQSKLSVSKRL